MFNLFKFFNFQTKIRQKKHNLQSNKKFFWSQCVRQSDSLAAKHGSIKN